MSDRTDHNLSIKPEILVDRSPKHHPHGICQVQLPVSLLLPPLFPLVVHLVLHGDIPVYVPLGFVIPSDSILMHMGHIGDTVHLVVVQDGGGQPLHLLEPVPVVHGWQRPIIWEPT